MFGWYLYYVYFSSVLLQLFCIYILRYVSYRYVKHSNIKVCVSQLLYLESPRVCFCCLLVSLVFIHFIPHLLTFIFLLCDSHCIWESVYRINVRPKMTLSSPERIYIFLCLQATIALIQFQDDSKLVLVPARFLYFWFIHPPRFSPSQGCNLGLPTWAGPDL